jgi:hypothetical protein
MESALTMGISSSEWELLRPPDSRVCDRVERPPAATQMGRAHTVSGGHELTYYGKRHWN